MLMALALWGCTGETEKPTPDPAPTTAPRDGIHVEPVSIRWDAAGHLLSVESQLAGSGVSTRKEPVHVGVTVVTTSDKEVDLLVHTLFPAAMGESVMFSVELEEEPKHVLIGAWGKKVEPCESDRPGCQDFGFVLDESIASFPAKLYTEGMRQRLVPSALSIAVKGDPKTVLPGAQAYLDIFGGTATVKDYDGDLEPGVWVSKRDDLGIAHAIASAHPGLPYAHTEATLPAPVVVVLPD